MKLLKPKAPIQDIRLKIHSRSYQLISIHIEQKLNDILML